MGVLRQLFGPSREEVWKQLAAEIGARYESSLWTGTKVSIDYGQWMITLDSYTVSTGHSHHAYTRFRAPFVNPDGFRFGIYRKHLFTPLAKWLGTQDIEVGHPEFDEALVIQGNNETQVKALLADDSIRKLLAAQPDGEVQRRGKQAAGE